jgi:hypothetical protein
MSWAHHPMGLLMDRLYDPGASGRTTHATTRPPGLLRRGEASGKGHERTEIRTRLSPVSSCFSPAPTLALILPPFHAILL